MWGGGVHVMVVEVVLRFAGAALKDTRRDDQDQRRASCYGAWNKVKQKLSFMAGIAKKPQMRLCGPNRNMEVTRVFYHGAWFYNVNKQFSTIEHESPSRYS